MSLTMERMETYDMSDQSSSHTENDWTILPASHAMPLGRMRNPAIVENLAQRYGAEHVRMFPTAREGLGILAVRTSVLEHGKPPFNVDEYNKEEK